METETALWMLVAMVLGHTLADFTPMQTPAMLKAKNEGNLLGIVPHGICHALFVLATVLAFGFGSITALLAAIAEFFAHTCMDWTKGQVALKFVGYGDVDDERFWTLLGIDQAVHTYTKIAIVACLYAFSV